MSNIQEIIVIILVCIADAVIGQGTFTNLPNFPGSQRDAATSFSIGNFVYYATGGDGTTEKNDLWQYDVNTGIWRERQDMGAAPGRMMAASFALNGKGYVGTGKINSGGSFITQATFANDFYKYDPSQNNWTQIGSVGPTGRLGAVGFAVNGKGYIALGSTTGGNWSNIGASTKTIFELDPATDTWTERIYPSNFPGLVSASAFVLNGKAYIAGGFTPAFEVPNTPFQAAFSTGTYEFDPTSLTWSVKAFMPISAHNAAAFSTLDRGYIVGGSLANSFNSAWFSSSKQVLKYNPSSNVWTTLSVSAPQFMSANTASAVCEAGFMSTGRFSSSSNQNSFSNLQFSPDVDGDYIQTVANAVCNNFDVQFTLQLSAAGTVSWSTSPNIYITSGQGTKTINTRSSSTGSGWVQASINLGCRVVTFPQKVIWAGKPNTPGAFTVISGNLNNMCVNSQAQVLISSVPGAVPNAYVWTSNNPSGLRVEGSGLGALITGLTKSVGTSLGYWSFNYGGTNTCGSTTALYGVVVKNCIAGGGGGLLRAGAAYPNPSNESFTVKLKEEESQETAVVALVNKNLETVFFLRTEEKEMTIPTTNLPPGTYFLKVMLGKEITQKQLIINH
jgi:N-acetylneuraminic acid mutarotase